MDDGSFLCDKRSESLININFNIDEEQSEGKYKLNESTFSSVGLPITTSDLYWSENDQNHGKSSANGCNNNSVLQKEHFNVNNSLPINYLHEQQLDTTTNEISFENVSNQNNLETNFYEPDMNRTRVGYGQGNYSVPNSIDSANNDNKIMPEYPTSLQTASSLPNYYDDMMITDGSNFTYMNSSNNFPETTVCESFPPRENHSNSFSSEVISLIRDGIIGESISDISTQEWAPSRHEQTSNDHTVLEEAYSFPDNYEITDLYQSKSGSERIQTETDPQSVLTRFSENEENLLDYINHEDSHMDVLANPLTPQHIRAYTMAGQRYEIDRMADRPETFQTEDEMKIWDTTTTLNAHNGKWLLQKGLFTPSSVSKSKEKNFKKLLSKERENLLIWAETPNLFLLHDIRFLEKEYWLLFLDRLIKEDILTYAPLIFSLLDEIRKKDFSKINLLRCPQILKNVTLISDNFCCEDIPSKARKLYESLEKVLSKPADQDLESYINKEATDLQTKYACSKNSFKWMFMRGIPIKLQKHGPKKRKSDTTNIISEPTKEESENNSLISESQSKVTPTAESQKEIDKSKHPLYRKLTNFHSRLRTLSNHPSNDKSTDTLIKRKILDVVRELMSKTSKSSLPGNSHLSENCNLSSQISENEGPKQQEGFKDCSIASEDTQIQTCTIDSACSSPRLVICSPEHESEIKCNESLE